ncbi:MAG: hypothetical protein AAFQ82_18775 [Myxococcota bacterium]
MTLLLTLLCFAHTAVPGTPAQHPTAERSFTFPKLAPAPPGDAALDLGPIAVDLRRGEDANRQLLDAASRLGADVVVPESRPLQEIYRTSYEEAYGEPKLDLRDLLLVVGFIQLEDAPPSDRVIRVFRAFKNVTSEPEAVAVTLRETDVQDKLNAVQSRKKQLLIAHAHALGGRLNPATYGCLRRALAQVELKQAQCGL